MDVLRYDERACLKLRTLYSQHGYTQYRMSRFEEYSLYAENIDFLASGDIITFTGKSGKLMALRPDVTLSIVKSTGGQSRKLYYNENVYRPAVPGGDFKERMQVGIECIGAIDVCSIGEVVMLAKRSLELLDECACLDISHMGFLSGLLQSVQTTPLQEKEILRCINQKNSPELNLLCTEYSLGSRFRDEIMALTALRGSYDEILPELRRIGGSGCADALSELEELGKVLHELDAAENVYIDFSIESDLRYYSGVIFQGYLEGVPTKILSGGRYDKLLRKFGIKESGAIGFAVYLDLLERLEEL